MDSCITYISFDLNYYYTFLFLFYSCIQPIQLAKKSILINNFQVINSINEELILNRLTGRFFTIQFHCYSI